MDSTKVKDALVQIGLRMIPIVPVNEVKTLFNALTAKDSEIDQKVEEALTSLNKTSSVIAQLESAVRDKMQRLEKLQTDYKTYEQLTELTKEQVNAVSAMMQRTIERNRPKEIITALSIHLSVGIIFLIAGVILAHPIEKVWASIFADGSIRRKHRLSKTRVFDEYVSLVMNMAPDGLNVTFAIAPCASWGIVGQVNAIGAAIILPQECRFKACLDV